MRSRTRVGGVELKVSFAVFQERPRTGYRGGRGRGGVHTGGALWGCCPHYVFVNRLVFK